MNKTFLSSSPVISGNAQKVNVFSPLLQQKCRLTLIGDYHSSLNDERGEPFTQYSARMAQYGHTDMKDLEKLFEHAIQNNSDAIVLLGDMISFPSEKGVEVLTSVIKSSPIPVYYIAGNHDWHYEGWQGSDMQQRQEWINKRLLPLYNGREPLNYAVKIKGVKLIMIDNSVCQIQPSQLEFLRRELSDGKPAVIGCHIPLYLGMPDHPVTDYGCGHPEWGAASDKYYEIERREKWPDEGLNDETFMFCREVLSSKNVLGIIAGHVHGYGLETLKDKFQLVVSSQHSTILDLFGSSL